MKKIAGFIILSSGIYVMSYLTHIAISTPTLMVATVIVLLAILLMYPGWGKAGVRVGAVAGLLGAKGVASLSAGVVAGVMEKTCENTMQSRERVGRDVEGFVSALFVMMESRDPYTAGHQRRVAGLARAIAREMGLPERQVAGVFMAGLLHDIGKGSVPFEILMRPGRITPDEMNIIRGHSLAGYQILEHIDFPWPVREAVLQHHERMDGSGYPAGLRRGQILLEARILGVADVVEAMSSHRPYRPALGLESALKEIAAGSGVLYDSAVADACLRLLDKRQPLFDSIMADASFAGYAIAHLKA